MDPNWNCDKKFYLGPFCLTGLGSNFYLLALWNCLKLHATFQPLSCIFLLSLAAFQHSPPQICKYSKDKGITKCCHHHFRLPFSLELGPSKLDLHLLSSAAYNALGETEALDRCCFEWMSKWVCWCRKRVVFCRPLSIREIAKIFLNCEFWLAFHHYACFSFFSLLFFQVKDFS